MAPSFRDITLGVGKNSPGDTLKSVGEALSSYFVRYRLALYLLSVAAVALGFALSWNWLTAAAILLAVFEVATVLILRAHYTMDAFTGVVAAFWVADLSSRISPRLDQLITAKP